MNTGCRFATDDSATSPCHQCQYGGEGFGDRYQEKTPNAAIPTKGDEIMREFHRIAQEEKKGK
jgi:hypothetical protein